MGEHLLYLQSSHDSVPVVTRRDRELERRYFEVAPYPLVDGSPRVTEFEEKAIVDWLMAALPSVLIVEPAMLEHIIISRTKPE
jgi:hypothetical protein